MIISRGSRKYKQMGWFCDWKGNLLVNLNLTFSINTRDLVQKSTKVVRKSLKRIKKILIFTSEIRDFMIKIVFSKKPFINFLLMKSHVLLCFVWDWMISQEIFALFWNILWNFWIFISISAFRKWTLWISQKKSLFFIICWNII